MRAAPRSSRGAVNPLTVLLLTGIAVAIYCVVIFAPPYLDHIDVMDAVGSAYNQTGVRDDSVVERDLKDRLIHSIGTHREQNEEGELVEVRGLGVADEDVTFEVNRPEKTVHIEVRYVREVRLKPSSRWTKLRFTAKKTGVPAGLK